MWPGPVLALFGPLAPALITYGLRRWSAAAGLLGLVLMAALAAMVAVIPLEATPLVQASSLFAGDGWQIFGRTLTLTPGLQATLPALYLGAGLLALLSAVLPQGRVFVPVMLALLSPLVGGLLAAPFSFSVLPLIIVAGLAVWLIQAGQAYPTRAAWRFLAVYVLAGAPLLLVGWITDSDLAGFSGGAWRYYLLGSVLILGGFPFYTWVQPLLEDAPPLTWAVLLGLVQWAVIILVAALLTRNPILSRNEALLNALRASGAASMAAAGLLAAQPWLSRAWRQITLGRALAYVLLIDMGASLILAATQSADSLALLLWQHIARFISLALVGAGAAWLTQTTAGATVSLKRAPWAAVLLLYGAFSLAGLPLTPGSAVRWRILMMLGESSLGLAILILLATISSVVLLVRVGLEHWPRAEEADWRAMWQRQPATSLLLALVMALALALALYPRPLTAYAAYAAQLLWGHS